jgi:type IX secretion system PorP/SprF family membrane protein
MNYLLRRRIVEVGSLFFLIFALCSSVVINAQDYQNFTQFYFNPSLLNPSYAGIDGRPTIVFSYRRQWAGLEGGPSISGFNIQSPSKGKVSLGLNLSNEKTGLVSASSLLLTGAYTVELAEEKTLRFGLSAGAVFSQVDMNALTFGTPDPLMATAGESTMRITGNAGISYHSKTFHFGVAMPEIFEPSYISSSSFEVTAIKPFESLTVHMSNRFYMSRGKNVFEPFLIYRFNQGFPSQLEVAALLHLQNVVWLGASYKQDYGISAMGGFKINKVAAIGYSYGIQNTGVNEIGLPSHEVHLGLLLGKLDKKKGPIAYSFVDTDKYKKKKVTQKTKQQIAAEQKKREALLAKKKEEDRLKQAALFEKQQQEQKRKAELAAKEAASKKAVAANLTIKVDSTKIIRGGPRKKATEDPLASTLTEVDSVHAIEETHLMRLEDHAQDPTEHHGLDDAEHPHAERHEFVKRGNHQSELEIGDYVVAGVFKLEANAKKYSDGLIKLGFAQSDYGHLTEKNLWYVHIAGSKDIETAKNYRDKFRKMKIFREAWLLTVFK